MCTSTRTRALTSGGEALDHGPLADVGASVLRWLTQTDTDELPGTPFV